MNERKRNHNCHCFGTVCHDNTADVRDVLVPSKAGGPDALDNYQPMCAVCNQKKGSKCLSQELG